MSIEEQAQFVAKNAKHNLRLIKRTPAICNPDDLDKNIKVLEMMIRLYQIEMKAQKNARRAGRARWLKKRITIFLSYILFHSRQKSKAV